MAMWQVSRWIELEGDLAVMVVHVGIWILPSCHPASLLVGRIVLVGHLLRGTSIEVL